MGDASGPEVAQLQIPVIDISGYLQGPVPDAEKTREIVQSLRSACQSPGFFQIIGHNVSETLRKQLLNEVEQFFALPRDQKQALHRGQSHCLRGYESVGEQTLESGFADQKEGFMIGLELPDATRFLQGPNQWPAEADLPGFRSTFMEYFDQVLGLSKDMFRLMALSLDLEETYFDEFVSSQNSIPMCRAHRYPPATEETARKSRGIGAHTDFGALTLLMQDQSGGLEVFHKPSGTWHAVTPVRDAFVVNIGDMMERWTNEMYTSTLHRVITPVSNRYRYSVAFFNEGLLDQLIECIPTCLESGEQPKHQPIRAEDHLKQRYGNSY